MFATFNGAGCTVSRRTPVLGKGGESIGIPHKRLSIQPPNCSGRYSAAQAAIRNNPNQFAERTEKEASW